MRLCLLDLQEGERNETLSIANFKFAILPRNFDQNPMTYVNKQHTNIYIIIPLLGEFVQFSTK